MYFNNNPIAQDPWIKFLLKNLSNVSVAYKILTTVQGQTKFAMYNMKNA